MNRLVAILTAFGMSLLLGACAALSGKHGSFAIYAPQLDLSAHAQDNAGVPWQLLVDTPQSSGTLDTARIAVMPSPGVLEVYADARWGDPAPTLLRNLIVRAFETDARVNGVSAVDAGLGGDTVRPQQQPHRCKPCACSQRRRRLDRRRQRRPCL